MKSLKTILAILLIIAICITGCGKKIDKSSNTSSKSSSSTSSKSSSSQTDISSSTNEISSTSEQISTSSGEKNKDGTYTYYVAQKTGNDENPGTKAKPFASIVVAVDLMKSGDTCLIGDGIYYETIYPINGTAAKPMTIDAISGQKPIVTGTTLYKGSWRYYKNNIYATDLSEIYYDIDSDQLQVFANESAGIEARWPNLPGNSIDSIFQSKRAIAQANTNFQKLVANGLPTTSIKGAKVTIWPGPEGGSGWVNITKTVSKVDQLGQVFFEEPFKNPSQATSTEKSFIPTVGNPYFIHDSLELLDAPGEYYLDKVKKRLYFYTPDGKSPENYRISLKSSRYSLNMDDNTYVKVRNIKFYGAGFTMENASNCIIENCTFKYSDYLNNFNLYQTSTDNLFSNIVTGENNIIRRCEIGNTASCGIILGGTKNVVTNNNFHDTNYSGTSFATVLLYNNADGATVSFNTMKNTGGTHIVSHGNSKIKNVTVNNNSLYEPAYFISDTGIFYFYQVDGGNTVIKNNYVDGTTKGDNGAHEKIVAGIYIDSFSVGFSVLNNIVVNVPGGGLVANLPNRRCVWANNTVVNCPEGFDMFGISEEPDMTGTTVINNLFVGCTEHTYTFRVIEHGVWSDKRGVLVNGSIPVIDDVTKKMNCSNNLELATIGSDFKPTGLAIGTGITFPPYITSSKPDIGAIEANSSIFKHGSDWVIG